MCGITTDIIMFSFSTSRAPSSHSLLRQASLILQLLATGAEVDSLWSACIFDLALFSCLQSFTASSNNFELGKAPP